MRHQARSSASRARGQADLRGLVLGAVAALLVSGLGLPEAIASAEARVASGPPAVVVAAAGGGHSLVVGDDGLVYGTGNNEYGQLTGTDRRRRTLTVLTGLPAGVRGVAAAASPLHSLVVGDDGRVYGTGWSRNGQLTGRGRVYGTGGNEYGQLTGKDRRRRTLTPLTGLPAGVRAVAAAAGVRHSLVVGDNGQVYGTGLNDEGQLTGTGSRDTLRPLTGLPAGVRAVAAAAASHSLVVGDDGQVYGTGSNDDGQLTGTGDRNTLTPLTGLPAGVRATAAAAAASHSLVVGDDGLVYGTGDNEYGQLTGTGRRRTLTVLTGLPAGVRGVAAAGGWLHSLVVGDDGLVYGSGANYDGELTGNDPLKRTLTVLTGLPAGVRAVAAGAGGVHSLVVGDDGRAYGTGWNRYGQLTGTDGKRTLTRLVWGIANTVRPRITGTLRLGQTLTARHGRWWPVPTAYTYRWYRNATVIKGARDSTHRVVTRDVGTRLRVKVTARHPGYQPTSTYTARTARITRR